MNWMDRTYAVDVEDIHIRWSDVCSLFPERLNGGEKAAVIGINVGTEERK